MRTVDYTAKGLGRQVALAAILLLTAVSTLAQSTNTVLRSDWLKQVEGFRGEDGVEVLSVEDKAATREVTIAIPKSSMDKSVIEEVLVVGQRPETPDAPKPLPISYQWLDDFEGDRYGLLIRLGKGDSLPIRLYFNADAGSIR